MALITVTGPVTGLRIDTTTSVSVDTAGNTASTSTRSVKMNFRVANRAAYMKAAANLTNGDMITAAGTDKSGELEVIAFRNYTTNLLYWVKVMPLWVGILVSIFGLMFLGVLIGWFILPIGAFMMFQTITHKKKLSEAFALIKAAPAPINN